MKGNMKAIFFLPLVFSAASKERANPTTVAAGSSKKPLIIGGDDEEIENYPSTVSFQVGKTHFCSGVVVSPLFVMTAAHCLESWVEGKSVKVDGGSSKINDNPPFEIKVKKYFLHKHYSASDVTHDLAMAVLDKPIPSPSIAIFANSTPNFGTQFTALGWGVHDTDVGKTSPHLQSTKMVRIRDEVCVGRVPNDILCGLSLTRTATPCSGDSGGGAFFNSSLVAGILSYGFGCENLNLPAAYTKAETNKEFICCASQNQAVFSNTDECGFNLTQCDIFIEKDMNTEFSVVLIVVIVCASVGVFVLLILILQEIKQLRRPELYV